MKSVYSAVGTGSLNKTFYSSSVKGYSEFAMSGRDASVCAINVLVPYTARFVDKETIFFYAWRLLNHHVEGSEDDG